MAAGTRYLVFFALFASGGNVLAVHQVTNLATGAIVDHGEEPGIGSVGTSSLDVQAGTSRVSYSPRTNSWSFSAGGPGHRSRCANARRSPTRCTAAARAGSGSRWRARRSATPRRGWPPKAPSATAEDRRAHRAELARPPVGRLPRRPARLQLGLVLLPVRRRHRADAVPVPRPADRPPARPVRDRHVGARERHGARDHRFAADPVAGRSGPSGAPGRSTGA